MSPGPQAAAALHPQDSRVGEGVSWITWLEPVVLRVGSNLARLRESTGRLRRPSFRERRGEASAIAKRRVRAFSSLGLSHCGDTLSPPLSRKRERERTVFPVRTQLPQPPVPPHRNLILTAIKFAQCTSKPFAVHNVDILGRHGLRAGRAIILSMFPVFASVTRLAGGRGRKGSLRFSISVRDTHDRYD
jgi:hypothetical protein